MKFFTMGLILMLVVLDMTSISSGSLMCLGQPMCSGKRKKSVEKSPAGSWKLRNGHARLWKDTRYETPNMKTWYKRYKMRIRGSFTTR